MSFATTLFIHSEFKNDNINDKINIGNNKLPADRRETELIKYISNDPHVTIGQLSEQLNVSKTTVSRMIKELKERKIICRSGSNKSGKWVVLTTGD